MFGFIGKPGSFIKEFEGNGQAHSTYRMFGIVYCHRSSNLQNRNKMIIDYDNVGVQPTFITKGYSFIGNTGSTYFTSDNSSSMQYTVGSVFTTTKFILNGFPNGNNHYAYTPNTALTPPTRKYKIDIQRPDFIHGLYLYGVNMFPNETTSTNNFNSGATFSLDLRYFNNLKVINFHNGIWSNNINITFPNSNTFESFFINSKVSPTTLNFSLPSTTKHIGLYGSIPSVTTVIQNCNNCETLLFANVNSYNNANNSITGALNISHMTNLKDISIHQNNSLTSLTLPSGKSDWNSINIEALSASQSATINTSIIGDILSSSTLQSFYFFNNRYVINRNITNTDMPPNIQYFQIGGNSFTGDITLTSYRPVKQIFTGNSSYRSGAQQNSHPNVNITGLTACQYIDLSGSNIQTLQLPNSTACQTLILFDNKLDINTNPTIINQINLMTGITSLRLGNSSWPTPGIGQTPGFGANVSFASLVNCTMMWLDSCGLTGSLTIPNVAKLTELSVSGNTGLTNIVNLTSHATTLQRFNTINCTSYTFAITNVFTSLFLIYINNCGITSIDLSGKTNTSVQSSRFVVQGNPSLTQITFPPTLAACLFVSGAGVDIRNNPLLTNITNMENMNWASVTGNINNTFYCLNNALNITFPFGTNSFIPRLMDISNNGMSNANVNATITSLYNNRTKWSTYTIAKSFNIGGTNAAATGTYQAPAGFVLASNDGTPASPKEMLYVLVNNYAWSITYN
jgi:hypothetical protein